MVVCSLVLIKKKSVRFVLEGKGMVLSVSDQAQDDVQQLRHRRWFFSEEAWLHNSGLGADSEFSMLSKSCQVGQQLVPNVLNSRGLHYAPSRPI